MKHMKIRRLLTVLLTLCTLLSILPTAAFADNTEIITITYDVNGGIKGPHFDETVTVDKGNEWTVIAPSEDFVKAPEGKGFDALLINGVRYEAGAEYTYSEDITIKFLWKDMEAPDSKANPGTGAYDTSSLMMAAVMTASAAYFLSKKYK